MKHIVIIIILFCSAINLYGQDNNSKQIVLDSAKVSWFVHDTCKFWMPTNKEFEQIDSITYIAIKEFPKHTNMLKLNADSINNYYRQYVCYIDRNGDKIVYVNALCNNPMKIIKNIKHLDIYENLVIVKDGWDCYWHLYINISKRQYNSFNVNGDS